MADFDGPEHPLGRDVDKIHNALLTGADKMLADGSYTESLYAQFKDPFETGKGFSRLKLANWTTKLLVWIEFPLVPEDEGNWYIDWGTGKERSMQRIQIRDMLFRGFATPFGQDVELAEKLVFDITANGVALTLVEAHGSESHYGAYEGEVYSRIENLARTVASLDELVILADAV